MAQTNPFIPVFKEFVVTKNWKIAREDSDSVSIVFGGKDSAKVDDVAMTLTGRQEQNDLNIKLMCCQFAPASKRKRLTEFCTRASYGLNFGSFGVDVNDGEIYFKYGVDVEGCTPTDVVIMLSTLTTTSLSTWNKYLPGFKAILSDDNANVATLISNIEK